MSNNPSWLYEDEVFELRELLHLSHNNSFKEFFSLPFGSVSQDGAAIVGRAGFLFISNGSNHWQQQVMGETIISAEKLSETVTLLNGFNAKLKERNIEFRFLVVPEKDIVYGDLTPNAPTGISKERSVHQIIQQLAEGVALYPFNKLLSARSAGHIFHARDSHTNLWGATQVINALLESLNVEPIDLSTIRTETLFKLSDLSAKWVKDLRMRQRILARSLYTENIVFKAERHTGTYIIFKAKRPKVNKTLMIFGDSYSWNLDAGFARLLACVYQEVHFVWNKQIDWKLVDTVKPDIFILQSAERYLVQGLK